MHDTLGLIAKHLPTVGEGGALGRFVVDAGDLVWVNEDISPIILLKGHLIIEAELIDICSRLLANPAALEKEPMRFSTRLKLVQALLEDGAVPEAIWQALRDINSIRNKLAHKLEARDIDSELQRFLDRFNNFEDFRAIQNDTHTVPQRLHGCLVFLCGVLSSIGKPIALHESVEV